MPNFGGSHGEIQQNAFHVFYPEDSDQENLPIKKLTKKAGVTFLDPYVDQMVKVTLNFENPCIVYVQTSL